MSFASKLSGRGESKKGVLFGAALIIVAVVIGGLTLRSSMASVSGELDLPDMQVAYSDEDHISDIIHAWAEAWEKNVYSIEEYQSFYDKEFYAHYKSRSGMDYYEWMADKKAKGRKARCIEVSVWDITVDAGGDFASAVFMQEYVSDTYCDKGMKTLYFKRRGNNWKIVGEEQPKVVRCRKRCD